MVLKDQEQNRFYRSAYGLFPAIIFGIFILLISTYFVSTYYVMSPRVVLDEWSCSGKAGDHAMWKSEMDKLNTAQKLDPWNADIYMDIGRMYEWKALSSDAWNSKSQIAREQAIHNFQKAITYRPTWAMAWVSYAQSQLLNRVLNEQVFLAISNGFKFGRWQEETQKKLLWLSIGIWGKLPDDIKTQVRNQVSSIMGREDTITMLTPIAIRFKWFDELMPLVKNEKDRQYLETVRNSPEIKRNILQGSSENQDFVCRVANS